MPALADAAARARRVRLLLLDVDGVLTDGTFQIGADGEESKRFHSRDGLGIRLAQGEGIQIGLVTGRRSQAVARRAAELEIEEVHQGVRDKWDVVSAMLERLALTPEHVAFVGDDLVDLPTMRRSGLAVTVPEAPEPVRRRAHLVTVRPGGAGAVREVIEFILEAQGRWSAILSKYDSI